MPTRILVGAMCVQRFDDSLNSAIHITYRISLRSSSMPEPRDPLLKVLFICGRLRWYKNSKNGWLASGRHPPGGGRGPVPQDCLPKHGGRVGKQWVGSGDTLVMIPPLVHQRRPCYDFYFL